MRLALAVALLLAAPVSAQGAWSGQTLSGSHLFVDPVALAVSQDGRALAAWSFQDAVGNASRFGASSASRAPGAAAFGAPRALVPRTRPDRRSTTVEDVAAYGRRRALVATTRQVGRRPSIRLEVRSGDTIGRFGAPRAIRTHAGPRSVSLSVNARGDAALAWFEDRGVRTDRVYVALRRAGHRFGKPRRLATGRIRSVAAAVGPSADVLVAWDARGTLRTRFKPRTRAGFRATETIRSRDAFFAELHPVVTAGGRAVLAWSAQFLSEGGPRGPVFFQAAVRPAGAARFRRAALLETMPAAEEGGLGRPLDAVADSTGRVAIAWSGGGATAAERRVRVARDRPDGGIGPAQDVSTLGTGAILSDLAAGPAGRLVAVWDGGVEDQASVVRAAVADGAGAPFGLPEDVSPAGENARFARAAFLGDRPAVVLANRPGGGNDTVAQAYVR
jgi:hypothetical protein